MSWLFFMDESGHDHKNTPLEVRGGIALHVSKLWGFIQAWQRLELHCFGVRLSDYMKEGKGAKLLDKDRLKWAKQTPPMPDDERRKNSRVFLHKGRTKEKPTSSEFAGYGQASVEMARGVFDLLASHDAQLFAAAIPRGTRPPPGYEQEDYLRKDHVYLFERFCYFLEAKQDHGLIVMDATDKQLDKQFVQKMERYFTRTATGRNRAFWIVPAPLFVSSDMTYAVQAADICLYCINWGFRSQGWPDAIEQREEIVADFGPKLHRLQWAGEGSRDGKTFRSKGIILVSDPYGKNTEPVQK
jgi:hypothetical protein